MTPATRARLRAIGMNQKRFCRDTGLSAGTVSRWGKRDPGLVVRKEPEWVNSWLKAWEYVVASGLPLPWVRKNVRVRKKKPDVRHTSD